MLNLEEKKEIFPQKMREATLLGLYLIYLKWKYQKLHPDESIQSIKINNDYQIIHITKDNENEIFNNKNDLLINLSDLQLKFITHQNLCVNVDIHTEKSINLSFIFNQNSHYVAMAKYYIGFFEEKRIVKTKIPKKFSLLNYFMGKENVIHKHEEYLDEVNTFKWELNTDDVVKISSKLVDLYTDKCSKVIKLFSDNLDQYNQEYFSFDYVRNNISNVIQILYDNINSDKIMNNLNPEFQKILLDEEIKDIPITIRQPKIKI